MSSDLKSIKREALFTFIAIMILGVLLAYSTYARYDISIRIAIVVVAIGLRFRLGSLKTRAKELEISA